MCTISVRRLEMALSISSYCVLLIKFFYASAHIAPRFIRERHGFCPPWGHASGVLAVGIGLARDPKTPVCAGSWDSRNPGCARFWDSRVRGILGFLKYRVREILGFPRSLRLEILDLDIFDLSRDFLN
jgi:hypothetical protein